MRRRTFLVGSGAMALSGLSARSWAADVPSSADLNGDVEILRQALELHPGLLRYQSENQVRERMQQLRSRYVAATTTDERYLALSAFLSAIRCGHSYANFYNQKKAVATALFDRPTRLPVHFAWVADQMVVLRDPSGNLPRGTRIARLNGERPAALRARLMPLIRSDGHNDAKRISLLEVRGDDEFETFDIFQGLVAPPAGGVHRLESVLPGGGRRRIDLPAIGLKARQAQRVIAERENDQPQWRWEVRADGVAVLTMPGWALYNSKWDWKSWLDERLDSLGGAKGLVVDLRDNEGGLDCGDVILARIIDRPWTPPAVQQRLRFERTPKELDRYLDTWDSSFRTLGVGGRPLGDGFVERPGAKASSAIEPDGKRLPVPLAVLVSPVNSSATFHFASNFKSIGGGRLYGRPTGGNRRGINGGAYFFVRLPASGLEFDLPLVGYFPLVPQPDAGILPDVAVAPSIADIAAGRDQALERAAADLRRA
jgi:hypothetical protein